MNKYLLAITLLLFAVFGLFFATGVFAAATDNVSGWAWSSNIGWISFNCTNQATCPTNSYGVHINADGTFTGYAWSSNIGWIHFAPAGPYPAVGPNHSVRVDIANGQVSGWARAVNHGDGWDGWIRMRGGNYGVSINFANGQFSGWAWGDMNIGWLSFNCADRGTCGANPYRVTTTFVPPPTIINLVNSFTPCAQSRIPTFSWQAVNVTMPYDYQIRLCSNAGCTGATDPLVSRESLSTPSLSWAPACALCCNILPYNNIAYGGVTYHGQVRARNLGGSWGSWSTASAFTTYLHCYPRADFLCDGANCVGAPIHENTVVTLSNNSVTHGGALSCLWTLPAVATLEPGFTTSQCTIKVKFSAPPPGQRNQNVTLTVTDTANYSCFETKTLEVRFPLPEYREIPPIIWLKNFFARIASVLAGF